jgi:hypothetical protein
MRKIRAWAILALLPTIGFPAFSGWCQDPRFGHVFLSEARIEALRGRIDHESPPNFQAFEVLRRSIPDYLAHQSRVPQHWYVPGYYRDGPGHIEAKKSLMQDANIAYECALYARLADDATASLKTRELALAWAGGLESASTEDDSRLSFSYHFPAFIFGVDLIRRTPVWSATDEQVFRTFLRETALPLNCMSRENNWGNWGLVLAISCAAYLEDADLFLECLERWKQLLEIQVDDQGHLRHEVTRLDGKYGLWYSHFSLMPQTLAAEIARVNGVDLFETVSPSGRNLEMAFHPLAAWTLVPASFPYWKGTPEELGGKTYFSYFEILNSRWPDEAATEMLRRERPKTANHCAPLLTLTHGEPLRED